MAYIERNREKQSSDEPITIQLEDRTSGSRPCATDIESTLVERLSNRPDQLPRQRSVRFRLTCLVLACTLPVCIIAFLFVYYSYQYKRALMDQRVLGITRALSTMVDRQLALMQASAAALATSRNLATGDLAAFHKQARTVLQDYPDYRVVLSDASGQEFVNTGVPFGKPLPIRGDLDVVRTVFDTGKPVRSNLYKGFRTGLYAFSVHVPVFQGNRVAYDLVFAVDAEDFQKVIFRQRIPSEWSACILDANKVLVARNRFPERFVGRHIFPAGVKPIDERLEGTFEAPGPEGVDVFATFSRSATTSWTVVIAIPKALIWADSRRWLMWVVGGVILLATMALVLALFFARRISGSIQALVAPALGLGRGEPVEIGQLDLREANNVGQSLVKASQLLQERTTEREQVDGAVRLSEEKFAKAFAKNQAAIGITRLKDGVFLEVNDTCVELSGYSREEMIGHSSRRIMWPTRDACARCLRKLREKGSVRGWEQEFLKKSGEVFVTELSAQIWILNGKKLVVTTLVDITARKRAEEALRESENKFRAFFETEAVGTAEVDLNGRYIQVNQRYCQITGYSCEELLGMSPADVTHPEDRDSDQSYFQGRVPILDIEKRYIRKDGRVIWVHVTAAMIRDGEGNVLRSAGVIQDITDRKQAESDQELNMKVLRTLNRNDDLHMVVGEVLGLVRQSTGLDAVGLRLQEGYDYPYYQHDGFSDAFLREENFLCARGRDGSIIRTASGEAVLECTCGVVLSGRADPGTSYFTEGGSFWTSRSSELLTLAPEADPRQNPRNHCIHAGYESVALIPVRSREQIIGLLQLNDRRPGLFTPERIRFFESLAGNLGLAFQRRQIEEKLRSNEGRLRLALEAANSGTWEWDLRTHKSKWSSDVWKLYGLDPRSSEPSYENWLSTIHPEDREMTQQKVKEATDSSAEMNVEYRVLDRKGEVRWLALHGRPILDERKNAVSYIGIVMDISTRKRAEEALLRTEKLAATGRMAATIAHEVNNPLAGATNSLYLASSDPALKPETKEYLTIADQELRRAAHITQQTLGFYRASGRPTPTALPKLIDEVLGVYVTKLQNRNITVDRRYRCGQCADGCEPCFLVNDGEMRQIISNLLVNGIDALNDHGTLYIRASRTGGVNESGPNLHLTIADNGCGVRQEHLRRIFEPFFTTKESFGTGLGLWVTQELVRQHNGTIKVRSRQGKGTVFRITFPATPSGQQTNELNQKQHGSMVQAFRKKVVV
jgi:PAS domain S-box-containing protein